MSSESRTVDESVVLTTGSIRGDSTSPRLPEAKSPAVETARSKSRVGRGVIFLLVVAIAGLVFYWKGRPLVHEYFSHVETDDAYVTGDPSTVGSRISEVVEKVLVKDNDFVEKGALLVTLDHNRLQLQVDQKRAEMNQKMLELDELVKTAESDRASLDQARSIVLVGIAGIHEAVKAIEAKQEQVHYRIASLRGAMASLRAAQADAILAKKEFDRIEILAAKRSATHAELDQRQSLLDASLERVKAAEQQVQQVRAQLALPPDEIHPDQIPEALERTDTEVRRSVATGQQLLAQLGVPFGKDLDPILFRQAVSGLLARPQGWIDQIASVRVAQGKLDQTLASLGGASFEPSRLYTHPSIVMLQKEVEEAELNLSYTEIRAPVSGFVNRKSVNPGDHVQATQALMSIQPLDNVYIVANFKETQLGDIVIGQPVEIMVDAYPNHRLKGRVSGFAAATGAASSLLPAENATGNFVKVVQRVPVRIDLVEPNPRKTPLFVGMSVVPEVAIKEEPTGPDAGGRLRSSAAVRAAKVLEASESREAIR